MNEPTLLLIKNTLTDHYVQWPIIDHGRGTKPEIIAVWCSCGERVDYPEHILGILRKVNFMSVGWPNQDLLNVIREHAYAEVAREKVLTVMFTEHGARVPAHWVDRTDEKIASLLSDEVLRAELARREEEN